MAPTRPPATRLAPGRSRTAPTRPLISAPGRRRRATTAAQAASDAIRGRDPAPRSCSPASTETLTGPRTYAQHPHEEVSRRALPVFKKVAKLLSAVACHPFRPTKGIARRLSTAIQVIGGHGDKKTPIFIAEIGWGSADPAPGEAACTRAWRARANADEVVQLRHQDRKRYRLRGVSWFSWRDLPGQGRQLHPLPDLRVTDRRWQPQTCLFRAASSASPRGQPSGASEAAHRWCVGIAVMASAGQALAAGPATSSA